MREGMSGNPMGEQKPEETASDVFAKSVRKLRGKGESSEAPSATPNEAFGKAIDALPDSKPMPASTPKEAFGRALEALGSQPHHESAADAFANAADIAYKAQVAELIKNGKFEEVATLMAARAEQRKGKGKAENKQ